MEHERREAYARAHPPSPSRPPTAAGSKMAAGRRRPIKRIDYHVDEKILAQLEAEHAARSLIDKGPTAEERELAAKLVDHAFMLAHLEEFLQDPHWSDDDRIPLPSPPPPASHGEPRPKVMLKAPAVGKRPRPAESSSDGDRPRPPKWQWTPTPNRVRVNTVCPRPTAYARNANSWPDVERKGCSLCSSEMTCALAHSVEQRRWNMMNPHLASYCRSRPSSSDVSELRRVLRKSIVAIASCILPPLSPPGSGSKLAQTPPL